MCLGSPCRIISISGNTAVVESWGRRHEASLAELHEHVRPGDFIIEHLGVAVRRIPAEAVDETMAMYETILPEAGCEPFEEEFIREEIMVLALA